MLNKFSGQSVAHEDVGDGEVRVRNTRGELRINSRTGELAILPSDQDGLILEGSTCLVEVAGHRITPANCIYEELNLEEVEEAIGNGICLTISFRSRVSTGLSLRLHYQVKVYPEFTILRCGIQAIEVEVNEVPVAMLAPLYVESLPFKETELNVLYTAYCGGHTSSPLSQSGVVNLTNVDSVDSWWCSALFGSGGDLVTGFLTFFHYVGRIKTSRRGLCCLNPAENRSLVSGDVVWSEPLYVTWSRDGLTDLEAYAELCGRLMGAKQGRGIPCGWGTWGQYLEDIDSHVIEKNVSHLHSNPNIYGPIEVIEIDHGWEQTISIRRPECNWEPNHRFPSGMEVFCHRIRQKGLKVGLWLAPFAVNEGSRLIEEHPEYLVKDAEGRPKRVGGKGRGYCIDPTHPGAQAWLRELMERIKGWGIEYVKLDYLRCLLAPEPDDPLDGLNSPRVYHQDVTKVEAYRLGLALIREVLGDEIFILGCGAPAGPGIGYVDAHRIGQDIAPVWNDGDTGIRHSARNVAATYFWHSALWINDPDYLVLPADAREAQFWATVVALSGGSIMVSADLPSLESWQEDLIGKLLPPYGVAARPVDLRDGCHPAIWLLSIEAFGAKWHLLGVLNWGQSPREFEIDLRKLGLLTTGDSYHVWDFWEWRYLGTPSHRFTVAVEPRTAALLSLRKTEPYPQVIGSDMHFSQGAAELLDVQWRSESRVLQVGLKASSRTEGRLAIFVPKPHRPLVEDGMIYDPNTGILVARVALTNSPTVTSFQFVEAAA